jgi:hypothetical protein
MRVFDDGGGPKLYVAGGFASLSSLNSNNIVSWNGSTWSGVGGGLSGIVYALCVYDDGSGPALFASTTVVATGGSTVGTLAKWNGAAWTMVGSGITRNGQAGWVKSMVVFNDGTGPALYSGGFFDHVGSVSANGLAKWDGTGWSALPGVLLSPANGVLSLVVHDDGSGPSLNETSQDGAPPFLGVARWDGANWFALGTRPAGTVYALQSFDDGQGGGPALYAGGDFSQVGGNLSSPSVSRWYGNCAHAIDSMCFGDGTFAECPCANYGALGSGCRNSASIGGALLSHSGTTVPDTLQLITSSEPTTSTSVFLQSDALRSVQRFLGDGILCLGGQIRRMYVNSAAAGTAQAPQIGDPSITQRSASLGDPIIPGSVRFYQVWYRDNGAFCPPAAYNISNGLRVAW